MQQLLWLRYKIKEPLNWVGHLAIMRVFERAWRRTELPLAYSQGFNPRIRQSFGLPLVVGATSDCEYGDVQMSDWVNVGDVHARLSRCIHPSVEIDRVILAPTLKTSLMQVLRFSDYQMQVWDGKGLAEAVEHFKAQATMPMMKKTKNHEKEIDIKPLVKQLELVDEKTIRMRLQSGEKGTLKPMELLKTLNPVFEPVRLHRLASLDSKEQPLF